MKPPGWYEIKQAPAACDDTCRDTPHLHFWLRVRRWHPGYWLYQLRMALWPGRDA